MSMHTLVIAALIKHAADMGNTTACVAIEALCRQFDMNDTDIAELASQAGLAPSEWEALLDLGHSIGRCPVCQEVVTHEEGNVYATCSNGHKSTTSECF